VRVIAANTPLNLCEELARLGHAFAAGEPESPSFTYERVADCAGIRAALETLATQLEERGALGELYAARALELGREAALCDEAGRPGLWAAARQRYARRDAFDEEADAVALAWLDDPAPADEPEEELSRSDDERAPGSLISRMRAEIGRRRLPLRVVVKENLASLAATGDGFVQVVAGRLLGRRDVERTVLHELAGHAEPRFRASALPLGLFALGTAHGADDQEGHALFLERAQGFLDHARRREIALRHVAARAVEARADFVATARRLLGRGAPLSTALRIAARVHRGGGLGREAVYLPALLRVSAAIAADRTVGEVLRCGRVSVDAAPALHAWIDADA
jgi:hypothetical protein